MPDMIYALATAIMLATPGFAWDSDTNGVAGFQVALFGVDGSVVAFTNTQDTTVCGFKIKAQPVDFRVMAYDEFGQASEWTEPMRWPNPVAPVTNIYLPFSIPAIQSHDLKNWTPCIERTQEFTGKMRFFRQSRFYSHTVALPGGWSGGEVWACEQPSPVPPCTPHWAWEWDHSVEFNTMVAGVDYWFYAIAWDGGVQGDPELIEHWRENL